MLKILISIEQACQMATLRWTWIIQHGQQAVVHPKIAFSDGGFMLHEVVGELSKVFLGPWNGTIKIEFLYK
jgi:hypothetical protein